MRLAIGLSCFCCVMGSQSIKPNSVTEKLIASPKIKGATPKSGSYSKFANNSEGYMRTRATIREERNKNNKGFLFQFSLFNLLIRLEKPSRNSYLDRRGGEFADGVSRMAPRPNWKGYLKLSLVSCPIALYPAASETERVSFRQINTKTGNRLRQQMVDAETGDPVEREDRGRYEIGKGEYIPVEDEELAAIQVESTHTIEIGSFVPNAQIDKRYYDWPYYIVPTDKVGQGAFAVIREAMRGKGIVALGRVVISKREHVIALEPYERGLLGTTLRYPYEVRNAAEYFEDIADVELAPDMFQLAEHILESKKTDFDPSTFVDRYENAVVALLKQKQAGIVPKQRPVEVSGPRVVNLMDALRRSIAGEGTKKPAAKAAPARRRKQA
jgi:DNA end-binding protein Ku